MMPLQYQWFLRGKPTGEPTRLELQHGDLYIMSEKATKQAQEGKRSKIKVARLRIIKIFG
jgi:alkylated DNA repair dioxygenase AlkB